jgi:hypothetical protein
MISNRILKVFIKYIHVCLCVAFGMGWGLTFVIGPDPITPLSGSGNIHVRGFILIRILDINEITN